MSWAVGYDVTWKRDIGYGVPSVCDHPGCDTQIDRGLSYVCGGEPYGGEFGCGLFFCERHLQPTRARRSSALVCDCCHSGWGRFPRRYFKPTPDTPEWIHHKATHPSWAEWRVEQGREHAPARKTHVEDEGARDG
jgi:hypothetical protein